MENKIDNQRETNQLNGFRLTIEVENVKNLLLGQSTKLYVSQTTIKSFQNKMLKTAKSNLAERQSSNTLVNDFSNPIGAVFDPIFTLYRIVKVLF